MRSLLAKRPHGSRELALDQHLFDTEKASAFLFRKGSRWAEAYLRFFKIPISEYERFLLHLRVAALFHDIGKANEGFQRAIRSSSFVSQPLRHEHLSALLLAHPSIERWLGANRTLDQDVILAAVLSHHLKAAPDGPWKVLAASTAATIHLFFDDPQVRSALGRIAALAGIAEPFPPLPSTYQEADDLWADAFESLLDRRAPRFGSAIHTDSARRRLCLAVKAGVIVADSLASACFREELDLQRWIDGVAHASPLAQDAVEIDVLQPRIGEIDAAHSGRPFQYHPFQDGAARIGPRGLLLAACGAGKTLAAWRWADSVARSRSIGRVVFLYPTRGTATEGFRDYVGHAPEGVAALVHGTARYELEAMLANPGERPPSLAGKSLTPGENEARLFALGLWPKRYFSATVDQFLSFMEHDYRAICLLPALADAAVIFDEIHSYDEHMWRSLVNFLREFDLPVLCMTATLPPARREDLSPLLRMYPDAAERVTLADLARAEGHPRYRLETVADEVGALDVICAVASPGTRILWVVNTVSRCQSLASELRQRLRQPVLAYHSRFKLEDRQTRHRETVDAFRPAMNPRGIIAVTTQVCEMSLDLDADVLVTEHAPISSLVQRFGRANRHLTRGPGFRARLITYPPENHLPYGRDELLAAEKFLTSLAGRDVSQRELADALLGYSPPGQLAGSASRFLQGGFFATPGPFRETDEGGLQAILDSDESRYSALRKADRSTEGLWITVPRKHVRPGPHAGLPSWLGLADGSRYSTGLGFLSDDDLLSREVPATNA